MTPEAILALQTWLDNPEPYGAGQAPGPTVRNLLNTTAGTLWQQAVVRILQTIAPQPTTPPTQGSAI